MTNLIRLNDVADKFNGHLKYPGNNRIIFSGPFGIGKTRFLRTYFKQHEEDFICLHIFPVNYSIARNEDILDLLKYDVIYELLDHEISIETFCFTTEEKVTPFVIDNALRIFEAFSTMMPHIGKPISRFINRSEKLLAAYERFSKEIDKGEADLLKKLGKEVEARRGSYYQNDFYTKFITEQLEELASKGLKAGKSKEKVLIIDDLDRIDPEHIFRLLNVFSAHFDTSRSINKGTPLEDIFFPGPTKNKFGFDKVIFVCDLHNIRKIFQHRYGPDVDFQGYIDKFYSTDIFEFNNRDAIKEWLNGVLGILEGTGIHLMQWDMLFLVDIIEHMLNYKTINLRNLLKLDAGSLIPIFDNKSGRKQNRFDSLYLTKIARILTILAGDQAALKASLLKCSVEFSKGSHQRFSREDINMEKYMAVYILPVITYQQHNFQDHNEILTYLREPGNVFGEKIEFMIVRERSAYPVSSMIFTKINNGSTVLYGTVIFPELIRAVNILSEVGALD